MAHGGIKISLVLISRYLMKIMSVKCCKLKNTVQGAGT